MVGGARGNPRAWSYPDDCAGAARVRFMTFDSVTGRAGHYVRHVPSKADLPSRRDFGLSPSRREQFEPYVDRRRR